MLDTKAMAAAFDELDTIRIRREPFRKMNLLVVEDDAALRKTIADSLRAALFEVRTASDGLHVFQHLSAASAGEAPIPDCLVMDVRMPMCSGIEVLRAFRTAGWSQPVILVTAFPDAALRELAVKLGASVVLDKPIDTDDLVTIVQLVCCLEDPSRDDERGRD